MQIVTVTSEILGSQFTPFLRAAVQPEPVYVNGEEGRILYGIDPLKVDLRSRPSETWDVVQLHEGRVQNWSISRVS